MTSRTRRDSISFGRPSGGARYWRIGWSADEAVPSAQRAGGDGNRPATPGPRTPYTGFHRR